MIDPLKLLQADPNIDSQFRRILETVPPKGLTDADKIRKLRSGLSGMLELIQSFEDVTYSRDVPEHESAAVYESEIAFAKKTLEETK